MKTLLTATFTVVLYLVALCKGVPCWIRCHHPPEIRDADQVFGNLRPSSNPPLDWLARSSGLLTTYAGKALGIQGWKDYHLPAQLGGTVVQAAGSTDGLYTIDVQIEGLMVADKLVNLMDPRCIRVEVFPLVRIGAHLPKHTGDLICVAGELTWDDDGFLEIHPRRSDQIRLGRCAQ